VTLAETTSPVLLGDLVAAHAASRGHDTALIDGERRLSYGELERLVQALAGRLQRGGLRLGERVALLLPNSVEFMVAFLGILKAGGVVVPIGTRLNRAEIDFLLGHSDCRIVVHSPALTGLAMAGGAGVQRIVIAPGVTAAELAAPSELVDRPPDSGRDEGDDAVLLYTSGTTDDPKGVRLTHRGILHCVTVVAEAFDLGAADVTLCQLPMYHVSMHVTALPTLLVGGTLAVFDGFDAEQVLAVLAELNVTIFSAVSATAALLMKRVELDPDRYRPLVSLRQIHIGGAHIPGSLVAAWERFAPRSVAVSTYGLTEMSPAVTRMDASTHPFKRSSVGLPYRGIEVEIGPTDDADGRLAPGEIGEILVRGPSMMAGYLGNPQRTEQALAGGWLHTGDLGYRDGDGYLFVVGRAKNILKRGGETIFPDEILSVIVDHPDVKEAAVVAVPDDVMGERVAVAVMLQPGRVRDAAALSAHCATRLADFKVPEYFAFSEDELPKTAAGKIAPREILARIERGELDVEDMRRGSVRGVGAR
jgi:acyl-CoA synthetase (AMP-forming)/AMP-acid ligase II